MPTPMPPHCVGDRRSLKNKRENSILRIIGHRLTTGNMITAGNLPARTRLMVWGNAKQIPQIKGNHNKLLSLGA